MTKPSSTRMSRDSAHSIQKVRSAMSLQKVGMKKKKSRRKTLTNIVKLFGQLKDEPTNNSAALRLGCSSSSSMDTVIELDTTTRPALISSPKSTTCIVICDDEEAPGRKMSDTINMNQIKSPKHCSTPMQQSSKDLNIQNNKNYTINSNTDILDLTKEINRDSYLTIDLTEESILKSNHDNTVIDLVNTSEVNDCTLLSVSNASFNESMSGDSDVTVLNMKDRNTTRKKEMKNFVKGISKMNLKDRGNLLKLITKMIFNGCNVSNSSKQSLGTKQSNKAIETVEDTYIKEVILGETNSRNSIGSNLYNPERDKRNKSGLRMIVIDGSNVAMQHTMGRIFSVKGLKICIDYFLRRGHVVKAFVPRFRCKFGKSSDPRLLDSLERQGLVIYTPSREVQGRLITSYDDRYIVQCAAEFDGVIVSGDNYRDLMVENSKWRWIIENRLLQFTWVGDMIMFPKDPLGRSGPTLEKFLRH